jgi:hypothetical protein
VSKSLNLEQLRNQARKLLRAFREGDAKAVARIAHVLPHLAKQPLRLAQAQAAIARENHYPSWPKLKAAVEKDMARRKRRSAHQSLIRRMIDETIVRAHAGDAAGLTRITPLGKEAEVQIVAAISADPATLDMVVGVYIAGLQHPNPKVRYECAHALDRYGHVSAVEPLIQLSYDSVPRVRWMALHALSCDACKTQRPVALKAFERASELARSDDSVQVRRHATVAVGKLGGKKARPVLEQIAANDRDDIVRRNARSMLSQLAK